MTRRSSFGACFILLSLPLMAACLAPADCTVRVEPPRIGASASFAGKGLIDLGQLDFVGTATPIMGHMKLEENDTYEARISGPGKELGIDGRTWSTAVVEWLWNSPRFDGAALIDRNHVSLEDGHLVSSTSTVGRPGHLAAYAKFGLPLHPVLMWGNLYWDQELGLGWSREHTAPADTLLPGLDAGESSTFRLKVTDSRVEDGACIVSLEGFTHRGHLNGIDPRTFHLEVTEDNPFPLSYQNEYHGPVRGQNGTDNTGQVGQINQTSYTPGTGEQLQALASTEFPKSQLPRPALTKYGMVEGEIPIEFKLEQAIEILESDPVSRDWLAEHPAAAVVYLRHYLGAPNSSMIGSWWISFNDAGEVASWLIDLERPVLPGLPERHTVYEGNFNQVPNDVPEISAAPSMESMAQLYRQASGQDMEWIICELFADTCRFGSHELQGRPYSGSSGGTELLSGMVVELSTGRVLQHTWKASA